MKLPNWEHASLLHYVAARYRCNEVAAFDVNPFGRISRQRLHLRTGDRIDEETRQDVQQAFRDIVSRCVDLGRDGAVTIEGTETEVGPLCCLVLLARQETTVVGAAAYIVRCSTMKVAQAMLTLMRDDAIEFLEQEPLQVAA